MNCGEKIAKLRKQSNMTQAELGDALSVTYQAVSKWERGESQPDFDTISRISKLFQVPITYFEDGGEEQAFEQPPETPAPPPTPAAEIIGMCVQCGKVVRDGEAAQTEPKLICKSCAEHNEKAEKQRIADAEKQRATTEQQRKNKINYDKSARKKKRNFALIIATIPAAAVFIAFLVLSLLPSNKSMFGLIFGSGCVLMVFAYTFTAQMIWDGTVREVCLGGGHIISLPGIIFSLSPDGLIFLIVTKIFLAFVAALVFVGSIIFCVIAAIVISPIMFVPSLLWYNRETNKIGK